MINTHQNVEPQNYSLQKNANQEFQSNGQISVTVKNESGQEVTSKTISGAVGSPIGDIISGLNIPSADKILNIEYNGSILTQAQLATTKYQTGSGLLVITVNQPKTSRGQIVLPGGGRRLTANPGPDTKITTTKATLDFTKQKNLLNHFEIESVEINGETYTSVNYNNGIITVLGNIKQSITTTNYIVVNLTRKGTTPDVKPSTPDVKPSKPDVKPSTPDVKPSKPDVKPSTPDVKPSKPDVKPSKPDVKPSTPDVKPSKPDVKPSTPDVKPSKPDVKPSTPDVKPSKPDVKPSIPDVKPSTPDVKPSKPDVKPSTPDVKPTEKVKLTVEAVNENGQVLQTESTQGPAGANIDGLKVPTVEGYTLAGIKVNGKSVDMNTFKLPTKLPSQTENIQYVFKSNTYKTTVEIKDEAGNIVATKTTTGKIGTQVEVPSIPTGAKLVNIEVNGVVAKNNEYPSQITDKDTTIVINVEMPHTATVKYVDANGKDLGSSTTTGIEGSQIKYATVPKNYKIKSITVDGKKVNSQPTKLGSKNETIVITYEAPVAKSVKLTVEAVNEAGKVLFSENGIGEVGSEIQGLKEVPAQKGYTLEKILVNGKEVNKDTFKLPTKLSNENEVIQYVYKANEYKTTVTVMENGKTIEQKVTTGIAGTKVNMPTIPQAKIVNVIVNGKVSKGNKYPENIGTEDTNIVINVELAHKIDITFNYSNGTVQTGKGTAFDGSAIKYPTILKGYKIEKIMVNGKVVSELPTIMGNTDTNIIVSLVKEQAEKPVKPAEKPVKPAEKPVKPAEKPVKPAEKPVKPEEKPVKPAEKPVKPEEKPVKPAEKPVKPEEKPVKPAEKPVKPEEKPVKPAEKPVKPEEKPVKPAEKPVKPAEKPVKPEEKPVKPAEKPVKSAEKPVKPEEKPVKPAEKPVKPAEKPVKPAEKQTITSGKKISSSVVTNTVKNSDSTVVANGEKATNSVVNTSSTVIKPVVATNSNNITSKSVESNEISSLPATGLTSKNVNGAEKSMGVVGLLLSSMAAMALLLKRRK
ncbi:MAG: hypothetical protein ACRCTZ_00545 [Sarcina sp.]